jgi:hypothetical protein
MNNQDRNPDSKQIELKVVEVADRNRFDIIITRN